MSNSSVEDFAHIFTHRLDSVRITGAPNTRRSLFSPLVKRFLDGLSKDDSPDTTMRKSMALVVGIQSLGIFNDSTDIGLVPTRSTPDTPFVFSINVRELPRFRAKVNTDIGNSEGSVHGSLLWRNVFGSAEALSLDYNAGTRTRSAYAATLSRPLPWLCPLARAEVCAYSATDAKPWASCDELAWGGVARLAWRGAKNGQHEIEYTGAWRQTTGLEKEASRSVRMEAGDSTKSALRYTYVRDERDNPRIPSRGRIVRAAAEIAGLGPLGGDVGFAKSEVELGGAVPLLLAGVPWASVTAGFKTGLLCPLPVGFSARFVPSRLPDRFRLGGPLDVRGFQVGGLGPHDGKDSLGGDLFAAGNVNLLLPVPFRPPDSALRIQLFANSGRLVALSPSASASTSAPPSTPPTASDEGMSARQVGSALGRALQELVGGPPSVAAGIGIVYGHPAARFELNFSLPLVARRGERPTKGLQVGFGLDFL